MITTAFYFRYLASISHRFLKSFNILILLLTGLFNSFLFAQQINVTGWSDVRNMQNPCDSVSLQISGDMDATYVVTPANVSISGSTITVEQIMIYGFATVPVSPNIAWSSTAELGYLTKGSYTLNIIAKLSTVQYGSMSDTFTVNHNYTFLRDSLICNGDSIRIGQSIYGMSNPSYSWSNGKSTEKIYISQAGAYILNATGSNCSVKDSMELSLTAPIADILQDSGGPVCIGDSIVLGGGPSYYSYKWSDKSTGDTLLWVFNTAGTETIGLTVTDSNACNSEETVDFIVKDCDTVQAAVPDFENNVQISIYPNPASDWITISYNGENKAKRKAFTVTDLLGHVVYAGEMNDKIRLNTSTYSKGTYIVYVLADDKQIVRRFNILH